MKVFTAISGGRLVGVFNTKNQIYDFYLEGHECGHCVPGSKVGFMFCPVTDVYKLPPFVSIHEYDTETGKMIKSHKRPHKGATVG